MVLNYIRLLRPINFAIVSLTQWIIYYFIIYKNIEHPSLDVLLVFLLGLTTSLIAGCGYVINDIYDVETDRITKPQNLVISKTITFKNAYIYYFSLLLLGAIISIYIALKTDNLALFPLYPIANFILFLYAKYFKKQGYIGNNIVALMTAFVPFIILVAERKNLHPDFWSSDASQLILFFCSFSYLANLIREIVKDIEDMDGDLKIKSKSLPIVYGIERTKIIAVFNSTILVIVVLYFYYIFLSSLTLKILGLSCLIIPIIYINYKLNQAKLKNEFHHVSTLLKLYMITGLFFLITISNIHP
jgi:4-hydroxybenzoate polyprenyltransferase